MLIPCLRCASCAALILSVPSLLGQAPSAAQSSAGGGWVGGFTLGGTYTWAKLRLRSEGAALSGHLLPEGNSRRAVTLGAIQHKGAALRFEAPGPQGPLTFEGRLHNGAFTGTLKGVGTKGTFTFLPTTAMDREAKDDLKGLYQVGPGHFVSITWMRDAIPELMFTDYQSGRSVSLFPDGEDSLFGGSGILVPYPKEVRIQIQRDTAGRPKGLVVESEGRREEARWIPIKEQSLSFHSGGALLQGTLLLPPGEGPHPAVILTQTSSSATREAYRDTANFFLAQGLAALIYDKRGTGASTGDLARATFPILADDALAALRALKDEASIDPDRIGIWGASQGGWICQLAASRSKDVAFIIPTSGPSTTPEEQELFRIEHFLRADGHAETEVQAALAYQRAYFEWLRTNRGFDALRDLRQRTQGERWASQVYGIGAESYWEPTDRDFFTFDPKQAQERLTCPVLAIFGGKDLFVPVEKSIALLKARLAKAGNQSLTVQYHPLGSHGLGECQVGHGAEFPFQRRYVPDYFRGMARWLAAYVPPAKAQGGN